MPRAVWKENKTILYSSANIREKVKIWKMWKICLKCCDFRSLEIDNLEEIKYSGSSWMQPCIHSAKLSNSILFQTWKGWIRPFPVLGWFIRLLQLLDPLALKVQCHQKTTFCFIPEASDSQQGLCPNSPLCISTQLVPANALVPIKHLHSNIKLDKDTQT